MSVQVKSKQRVADHGEVFTNEREVKAMVDLVWKNITNAQPDEPLGKAMIDKILETTFLEPSCGSGNFLIEILRRKLALLQEHYKEKSDYGYHLVLMVGSIYGVELLEDNAEECRERLLGEIKKSYPKRFSHDGDYYESLMKSIAFVISQNIVCGDALTYTTAEGSPIMFKFWKAGSVENKGVIINEQSFEILEKKELQLTLFDENNEPTPIREPKNIYEKSYLYLYQIEN